MQRYVERSWRWLKSYRGKLFLSMMFCCLIPLGFMFYLSIHSVYRNAVDTTLQTADRLDNHLHDQLEARIQQIENTADAMQYDLYSIERTDTMGSISDKVNSLDSVRSDICLYIKTFDLLHICVFLPESNFGSEEGLYFFTADKFYNYSCASAATDHNGTSSIWFLQQDVTLPAVLNIDGSNAIGCARIKKNRNAGTISSGFIIFLRTGEISDLIRASFEGTNISGFLMTADGEIMAHSDASAEGTNLSEEMASFLTEHADGQKILKDSTYYKVQTLSNGWYQVEMFPASYVYSSLGKIRIYLTAIILVSTMCMFIATFLLSKTMTKRLESLRSAMNGYQLGNRIPEDIRKSLVISWDHSHFDEFDELGNTFITMSDTLNDSMDSILDLSLTEERLRYRLLQSQINPHFLYNILGTIRTCNSIGRPETANQMIDDLTKFYRLTLSKSGEMIPIRDEVEISRLYLQLEKLCRSNSLTWEFNLEDGIENYYICKFTLQPFLENCIHYGYSSDIDSIHISVDFRYGDDSVIATIRDNGAGMTDERLAEVCRNLDSGKVDTSKHFGTCSVAKRISSTHYGNGHIDICHADGRGTLVTITFAQIDEYTEKEE